MAAIVYVRSRKGKHYILAGTRFSDRTMWRLKRFIPAAYLSIMKSNARIQFADKNPSYDKKGVIERVLRSIRARVLG